MKKIFLVIFTIFLIAPCVKANLDDDVYKKPIPRLNIYSSTNTSIKKQHNVWDNLEEVKKDELNKENSLNDLSDFYTFYTFSSGGFIFQPLTKEQYKLLTHSQKKYYKNILKADKLWTKACNYPAHKEYYMRKALSYYPYLHPIKLCLAKYCIDKNNYNLAEYYLNCVPKNFSPESVNALKLEIFYKKKDYNNALICINNLINFYKIINYDKLTDKMLFEYLESTNNKVVKTGYNIDCTYIQPNETLRDYYELKYDLCKKISNNKLATITAEEMIKIWGQNEDFYKIAECIYNPLERIKSYETAKKIYEQRQDIEKVKYIKTLIYNEKYAMTHKNIKTNSYTKPVSNKHSKRKVVLSTTERRELMRDMLLIDMIYCLQEIEYQQMLHNVYCH